MKFPPFEYRRPVSLEALDACFEGDDTRLLAGGQSLLPLMAFRLARPRLLVDLAGVGELRGIRVELPSSAGPSSAGGSSAGPSSAGGSSAGGSSAGPSSAGGSSAGPSSAGGSSAGGSSDAGLPSAPAGPPRPPGPPGPPRSFGPSGGTAPSYLVVGAMTTHAELRSSALVAAHLSLLRRVSAEIGHPAIRHLGTIGGSLAHADPAAEWPATCIALGAEVQLHSAGGSRLLPVERLVLGPYQTALAEGEVLQAVRFPLVTGLSSALAEVARRPGDFALAGAVCTAWRSQPGAQRHSDGASVAVPPPGAQRHSDGAGVAVPPPGAQRHSDGAGAAVPPLAAAVTLFGVCGRPVRVELADELLAEPSTGALSALLEPHLAGALADHQADASFRRHLGAVVACRAIRAATAPPAGTPGEGSTPSARRQ